jgi:hypothetical protein
MTRRPRRQRPREPSANNSGSSFVTILLRSDGRIFQIAVDASDDVRPEASQDNNKALGTCVQPR